MIHIVRFPASDISELKCLEVYGSKKEALKRAKWVQKMDFPTWELIQITGDFRKFEGQDKIVLQSKESFCMYDNTEE